MRLQIRGFLGPGADALQHVDPCGLFPLVISVPGLPTLYVDVGREDVNDFLVFLLVSLLFFAATVY